MYLDKLDGRITTAFYDEKASAWRQEQTALQRRINELRLTTQNYNDAINNIENTSALCKAFPEQPAAEQRRLLRLLVEKATWQHGELETTLRPPFQKLRLSNHATTTKQGKNGAGGAEIENWLPRQDSNLQPTTPSWPGDLDILAAAGACGSIAPRRISDGEFQISIRIPTGHRL